MASIARDLILGSADLTYGVVRLVRVCGKGLHRCCGYFSNKREPLESTENEPQEKGELGELDNEGELKGEAPDKELSVEKLAEMEATAAEAYRNEAATTNLSGFGRGLEGMDPDRDISLRCEALSRNGLKVFQTFWAFGLTCSLAAGIFRAIISSSNENFAFESNGYEAFMASVWSVLTLPLLFSMFSYHKYLLNFKRFRWSKRRRRLTMYVAGLQWCTFISTVFTITPNVYMLVNSCGWFQPTMYWSELIRKSTGFLVLVIVVAMARNLVLVDSRKEEETNATHIPTDDDDLYMDKNQFASHWPAFVIGVVTTCLLTASAIKGTISRDLPVERALNLLTAAGFDVASVDACTSLIAAADLLDCQQQPFRENTMLYFSIATLVLCWAYLAFVARSDSLLRVKPYNRHKMANVLIRLEERLNTPTITVLILTSILELASKRSNCTTHTFDVVSASFSIHLLGYMLTLGNAYLYSPAVLRGERQIPQAWLQEMAWCEADLRKQVAERERRIAQLWALGDRRAQGADAGAAAARRSEPMFCMHTVLVCGHWSRVVYWYPELEGGDVMLQRGLDMYGLQHFDSILEPCLDTKAIIAWRRGLVVVAFRGTNSMTNVVEDLKAWRKVHPPARRVRNRWLVDKRPLVHKGFLRCWQTGGFNEKVLKKVGALLQDDSADTRVVVTGHSLGGALATLACFDMASQLGTRNITCYTIGQPRVGNHAFAHEFESLVPDYWRCVNKQDLITKAPYMGPLFRHVGKLCILTPGREVVVRPSYLERSVFSSMGGKVTDHFTSCYMLGLTGMCAMQLTIKRTTGGFPGVCRLAQQPGMAQLLREYGLDVAAARRHFLLHGPIALRSQDIKRKNTRLEKLLDPQRVPSQTPGARRMTRGSPGVSAKAAAAAGSDAAASGSRAAHDSSTDTQDFAAARRRGSHGTGGSGRASAAEAEAGAGSAEKGVAGLRPPLLGEDEGPPLTGVQASNDGAMGSQGGGGDGGIVVTAVMGVEEEGRQGDGAPQRQENGNSGGAVVIGVVEGEGASDDDDGDGDGDGGGGGDNKGKGANAGVQRGDEAV